MKPGTLRSETVWEEWFKYGYIAILIWRFVYPHYNNPLDHIFSDPQMHWDNGKNLLNPTVMGSIDPKLYQLWIWMVRAVTQDSRYGVAVFTGLLSAALPFLWYRCCREIMPRLYARGFALLVGICPLLFVNFSYFMNETLMLDMLALAFWLTFRAARKQALMACALAGTVWVLCLFTRGTALPVVVLGMGYLMRYAVRRWWLAGYMALILTLCAIPAGVHSNIRLHVFSPFHFQKLAELVYLSGTQSAEFYVDGTVSTFSPTAFDDEIFYPFFFESLRPDEIKKYAINSQRGNADWDAMIADAREKRAFADMARDMIENIAFYMFSSDWPEADQYDEDIMGRINFHIRWIWPFLIVLIAMKVPRERLPAQQAWIVAVTLLVVVAMLVQPFGLLEGRYRKAIEPLLLLGGYLLIVRPPGKVASGTDVTAYRAFVECYMAPVLRCFKRGAR